MDNRIAKAIKQMTEPTNQGENSALWLYLQWVVGGKPDLPKRALADALLAHAEKDAPYELDTCALKAAVIYASLGDAENVSRARQAYHREQVDAKHVFLDLYKLAEEAAK